MSKKIKLSIEQIEDLIDFIVPRKGIPEEIADDICERNREKFIKQLESIEIYEEVIPHLKEELRKQYYSSLVQAGESVGIITAQSIGERQTQQTLNTFHSTGLAVKTVITGVPRFSELLNATKDPKAVSCNVYFNEKTESIQSLRKHVGKNLRQLNFGDFIEKWETFNKGQTGEWYEMFEMMKSNKHKKYDWGIRFYLKKDVLYEYEIKLYEICEKIDEIYSDAICVFSPDYTGIVDIYIDTTEITNEDEVYESDEEAKQVYLEEIMAPTLQRMKLFGIEGVKEIFYEKKGKEWMVETEGSNLKKILGLSKVDKKRTISNNMWDIYECFGVEATRKFLIDEFKSVISSDGTFVNDCHATLLVDVMTYSGSIISISRYGMKKEGSGPMAKASFEESLDNFLKAGIYGEKETTNGVSASIMLGKMAKFGTGVCDIKVDIKKLKNRPTVIEDVVEKN